MILGTRKRLERCLQLSSAACGPHELRVGQPTALGTAPQGAQGPVVAEVYSVTRHVVLYVHTPHWTVLSFVYVCMVFVE